MAAGLIAIFDRSLCIQEREIEITFYEKYHHDFVAIDVANDERGFKPEEWEDAFRRVKAAGIVGVSRLRHPTLKLFTYVFYILYLQVILTEMLPIFSISFKQMHSHLLYKVCCL